MSLEIHFFVLKGRSTVYDLFMSDFVINKAVQMFYFYRYCLIFNPSNMEICVI